MHRPLLPRGAAGVYFWKLSSNEFLANHLQTEFSLSRRAMAAYFPFSARDWLVFLQFSQIQNKDGALDEIFRRPTGKNWRPG